MLLVGERRRLARGPADDEAVGPVAGEVTHELDERVFVDLEMLVERRDDGGDDRPDARHWRHHPTRGGGRGTRRRARGGRRTARGRSMRPCAPAAPRTWPRCAGACPRMHDGPVLAMTAVHGGVVRARRAGYFDMVATADALARRSRAARAGRRAGRRRSAAPRRRAGRRHRAVGRGAGARRRRAARAPARRPPARPGPLARRPLGDARARAGPGRRPRSRARRREELGVDVDPAAVRMLGLGWDLARLRPEVCVALALDSAFPARGRRRRVRRGRGASTPRGAPARRSPPAPRARWRCWRQANAGAPALMSSTEAVARRGSERSSVRN